MNSKEKKEAMIKKMTGTGLFLYRNVTKAEIGLPKRSADNKEMIPPGGFFRGDSYFMEAMRGQIIMVENLQKQTQQILTEIPEQFTDKGKVDAKTSKNESVGDNQEVLLLEEPSGSVVILD